MKEEEEEEEGEKEEGEEREERVAIRVSQPCPGPCQQHWLSGCSLGPNAGGPSPLSRQTNMHSAESMLYSRHRGRGTCKSSKD